MVPVKGEIGSLSYDSESIPGTQVVGIGVGEGDLKFNASERKALCQWVEKNLLAFCLENNIKVFHLLFGLFLAEIVDTPSLQSHGIKTIHTIHNIPPQECSRTWEGDLVFNRLIERIRNVGVYYLNKKRICKQAFDIYICPSHRVKSMLSALVPQEKIRVIPHGGAEFITTRIKNRESNRILNILTVGGIVPHKNQHLIPEIARQLSSFELDFNWDIIGPFRNLRYVNYIKNEIQEKQLEAKINLRGPVSREALNDFYQQADVYIQLSSEEGFCMTVLDAISYGLPVLANPAGAIPEMLDQVNGTLIDIKDKQGLGRIIQHYLTIKENIEPEASLLADFKKAYTWKNAAEKLIDIYHE